MIVFLVSDAVGQDRADRTVSRSNGRPVFSLGVLNDRALELPSPSYPRSILQPKSAGQISVQVSIDLQSGKVLSAKAVSGLKTFRTFAEHAALKARFRPIEIEGNTLVASGLVIYPHPSRKQKAALAKKDLGLPVIVGGVINGRATKLPKPEIKDVGEGGRVKVRVVVDMSGNVIDASAIEGHSNVAAASESAARLAKFSPWNYCCGPPVYVVAYLVYSFR